MPSEDEKPQEMTEMPDLPPYLQNIHLSTESKIFGITVRALGFLIIVGTVCLMSILKIEVKEPLYTLVISAVSFYFGARNSNMMANKK